jgi:glycosyltransferase involved in cell wall biosynthesis
MEKVYAIIANYNYGEYVCDAIQSALDQTHATNFCVIDDGSSDGSGEKILDQFVTNSIATSYAGLDGQVIERYDCNGNIVLLSENTGASTARNNAIRAVWDQADYFLIIDADDIAYPEKVAKMLEVARKYPVAAVYADYHIHNVNRDTITPEYKKPYDAIQLGRECIVHSQALLRKECLEQVLEDGCVYDKELHGPASQGFIGCCEDYDLWIRLSEKFLIWHIAEPLSLVKVTGHNQSTPENVTAEIWQKNQQRMSDKRMKRMMNDH